MHRTGKRKEASTTEETLTAAVGVQAPTVSANTDTPIAETGHAAQVESEIVIEIVETVMVGTLHHDITEAGALTVGGGEMSTSVLQPVNCNRHVFALVQQEKRIEARDFSNHRRSQGYKA